MTVPVGGDWPGIVGSAGYDLHAWNGATGSSTDPPANDVVNLPAGLVLTTTIDAHGGGYTFDQAQADPPSNYLLNAAGTEGALAAYYTDLGQPAPTLTYTMDDEHTFEGLYSGYMTDSPYEGRETTFSDNQGNSTTLTDPDGAGAWFQWEITIAPGGAYIVTVTPVAGGNSVFNGTFWDASNPAPGPVNPPTIQTPIISAGMFFGA
jgi:hypothetical protein